MPRPPLCALACLALALGGTLGCGSDDDDSNGSAQAPPASERATPKTTTGDSSASTSATQGPAVEMVGSKFVPEAVSVKVGQKITWTNKDGYAHNVTSTSGEEIDSGNIDGGGTFSYRPKNAGTIAYTCTLHTDQNGTIDVTK